MSTVPALRRVRVSAMRCKEKITLYKSTRRWVIATFFLVLILLIVHIQEYGHV